MHAEFSPIASGDTSLIYFLRETQGQRIYKLKSYDFIHVSENQITDSIEKL